MKDENFYKEQTDKMLKCSKNTYSKGFCLEFEYNRGDALDFERFNLCFEMSKGEFKFHWISGGGFDSPWEIEEHGSGYFHLDVDRNLVLYFSEIILEDMSWKTTKIEKKFVSQAYVGCINYDDLTSVKKIHVKYFEKSFLVKFKEPENK